MISLVWYFMLMQYFMVLLVVYLGLFLLMVLFGEWMLWVVFDVDSMQVIVLLVVYSMVGVIEVWLWLEGEFGVEVCYWLIMVFIFEWFIVVS